MRASIASVDAGTLVQRSLPSEKFGSTWILAAGKAAVPMARAAVTHLGSQVRGGLVIAPQVPEDDVQGLRAIAGNHPVPGIESRHAGGLALELVKALSPDDCLLVLISGGASALMAVPAEGVSLEEKQETTRQLLRRGADIHALNTVRKHLSAIKGGQLAAATQARCTTLVISDVVGDDLSVIASGPTVADPSTFADALDILRRHGGWPVYPQSVVARLVDGAAGRIAETPKPGGPIDRGSARVIGGRAEAMDGAAAEARSRGFQTVVLEPPVVGEASERGREHLAMALAAGSSSGGPVCVISSGETTVTVTGTGRGGRNQEFALAAVDSVAAAGETVALASVGTDGIDGPTDAAGALVDQETNRRAEAAGLVRGDYLRNNDAYSFFEKTADLIRTGPTGTNVGDVQVVLIT